MELSKQIEHRNGNVRPTRPRKKQATYSDYKGLFAATFPIIKRDIFSDRLKVDCDGRWHDIFEPRTIGKLKSIARDNQFYSHTAIEDHLQRYVNEKTPELLVTIPPWDGCDRISTMAKCVMWVDFSPLCVEEIIKEWGAKMFLRLVSPEFQNCCIIIVGPQGIGKDFFIDTLIGALGEFAKELTISKYMDEEDLARITSSGLVIRIGEFDRTARFDTSTLKDLITKPYSDYREKYERAVTRHYNRCSFIASCNTSDIFRDSTGNRRFWLLRIAGKPGEAIKFTYPSTHNDKLQILAQFRELASNGYSASQSSHEAMARLIESRTPDDPMEALLAHFDERVSRMIPGSEGRGRFTNLELCEVITELHRQHGISPNRIRQILKDNGRSWRTKDARGYCLPMMTASEVNVSSELSPQKELNI